MLPPSTTARRRLRVAGLAGLFVLIWAKRLAALVIASG